MVNRIAIIPARANSKRIPGKNIRDFFGKPLLEYSIEAALEASLFSSVVVSTDSQEIADIAVNVGGEVPFLRSQEASSDTASTADVLLEVVSKLEHTRGAAFDSICCIYPTAIFLRNGILNETCQVFESKQCRTLMPVLEVDLPVQQCLKTDDEGYVEFKWPEYGNVRTQCLEKLYLDAGQFYWIKTEAFMRDGNIFTNDTIGFPRPAEEVQDVDTEADWVKAEKKFERLLNSQSS